MLPTKCKCCGHSMPALKNPTSRENPNLCDSCADIGIGSDVEIQRVAPTPVLDFLFG